MKTVYVCLRAHARVCVCVREREREYINSIDRKIRMSGCSLQVLFRC